MAKRFSLATFRRLPQNSGGAFCYATLIMLACLLGIVNFPGEINLQANAQPAVHSAHAPRSMVRGIYVIVPLKKSIEGVVAKAIQSPDVDGAFIKDTWVDVQPSAQSYDWSRLDSQISAAKSFGKKISVVVIAGGSTPDWVYGMGARSFSTVIVQKKNEKFCNPISLPVPWDPVFLREWTKFVMAFGRRYGSDPSIALVKITGVNYQSDEIQLPRAAEETLSSVGGDRTCHVPDQIAQWAALGYTSTRLANAFHTIADAFGRAFPNTPLAIMTGSESLPALGPDGRPDPQAASMSTTDSDGIESFLSYGRRTFGARFVAQNNGLRARYVDTGVAAFSATNPTGYQFDWPVSKDRRCIVGGKKGNCDTVEERQSIFASTIDGALQKHADYLELFPADIVDPSFNSIISDTHKRIWAAND